MESCFFPSTYGDVFIFHGIQAKLREVPSLEGHVLLKKLRDALEYLKGRFTGRNKEDVANAISMVCYFILLHDLKYITLFNV
jgi:hypothetical protein